MKPRFFYIIFRNSNLGVEYVYFNQKMAILFPVVLDIQIIAELTGTLASFFSVLYWKGYVRVVKLLEIAICKSEFYLTGIMAAFYAKF